MGVDPVTMFAIASATAAIGGSVMQAKGEREAAQAQANMSYYNASVAQQQADLIGKSSAFEVVRMRKDKASIESAGRAGVAKAGLHLTGSPLLALAESASNAELDIMTEQFNAQVSQNAAISQANLDIYQAENIRRAGKAQAQATLLGGGNRAVSNYFSIANLPGSGGAKITRKP